MNSTSTKEKKLIKDIKDILDNIREKDKAKKMLDEIKAFVKEYKQLITPRKVQIKNPPPVKLTLELLWKHSLTPTINNYKIEVVQNLEQTPEYKNFAKQIKSFNNRTEAWGRKNFKDKEWLWYYIEML